MSCSSSSRGNKLILSWLIIISEYTVIFFYPNKDILNFIPPDIKLFRGVIFPLFSYPYKVLETNLPGSLTSCEKATQLPFAASPPCFSICRFIHGEILDINYCSTIVKSFSSGGTTPGSMLFSLENILMLQFISFSSKERMQSTVLLNCSSVVKERGSGIFSNAKFMLFIFLLILSLFLLHLFLVCTSVSLSKGVSKVTPSFLHLECSSFSF